MGIKVTNGVNSPRWRRISCAPRAFKRKIFSALSVSTFEGALHRLLHLWLQRHISWWLLVPRPALKGSYSW